MPKTKKPTRKFPTTLFPLPKNRKRRPTDAETLLHALAIGIRDHATHAQLRELICHLPRICNRMSPFTATAEQNFELQEKVGELEREIAKLRRRKEAPTVNISHTFDAESIGPEAREALTKHIQEFIVREKRAGGLLAK